MSGYEICNEPVSYEPPEKQSIQSINCKIKFQNTYTSSTGAESSFKFIASKDGSRTSSRGLLCCSFGSSSFTSLVWEAQNKSYTMQKDIMSLQYIAVSTTSFFIVEK